MQFLSALFIILVGLMMTWYSEKRPISNICIRGLMPNLIKKSWRVSTLKGQELSRPCLSLATVSGHEQKKKKLKDNTRWAKSLSSVILKDKQLSKSRSKKNLWRQGDYISFGLDPAKNRYALEFWNWKLDLDRLLHGHK